MCIQVISEFTFKDMDFAALNDSSAEAQAKKEDFVASIIAQVAKSANVEEENVKVAEIKPGSVVLVIEITFAPEQANQAKEFADTATKHPEMLFDQGFTTEYGMPEIEMVSASEVPHEKKEQAKVLGTGAVVSIVLIGVAVLIGGAAWFFFRHRKNYEIMNSGFTEI